MQKHSELFHISMMLYAFGFIAAIVLYRGDQTGSPSHKTLAGGLTAAAEPSRSVKGKSGLKETISKDVPGIAPAASEKKI